VSNASRAVDVCQRLITAESRAVYAEELKFDYEKVRQQ
jgi:5-methyltetrahydrofolate--homocysteine methyltransferase